jgi:hypothetical protein
VYVEAPYAFYNILITYKKKYQLETNPRLGNCDLNDTTLLDELFFLKFKYGDVALHPMFQSENY